MASEFGYYDDDHCEPFEPYDEGRDARGQWIHEHYDVLQELYSQFKGNGATAFGGAFLQFATFADFIEFVWMHTCIYQPDLLKPRQANTDVDAGAGCQSRVHAVSQAGGGGPDRAVSAAVGSVWCTARD